VWLPKSQATLAVTDFERQHPSYMAALKSRVNQNFHYSEVLDNTPAGSTVFVQFVIGREGYLENPAVKASSGYASLDESCLQALRRVENFGRLPESYKESSVKVLYHCTYPGSSVKSSLPPLQFTAAAASHALRAT
jgi:protein TonB